MSKFSLCLLPLLAFMPFSTALAQAQKPKPQPNSSLHLNSSEYLEMTGLNVMLAHDFYPESHQGGVGIIQNGLRVATNGDLRLEPTPGQWQPVPKVGKRVVNRATGEVSVRMEYPDPDKNRKGFNPIEYPDLNFAYVVRVVPQGKAFKIVVDLDKPLPDAWIGKVGFNFELFPGILFGKSWYLDGQSGIFPRQSNGPDSLDSDGEAQIEPMATGHKLTVAPETQRQTMTIENLKGEGLQLLDGRARHTNGWFVVRSLVAKGASAGAIEWLVTPHAIPNWKYAPVVQVSQVGYQPQQQKVAVIETDPADTRQLPATLWRVAENGGFEKVLQTAPKKFGKFLRYNYFQLDFSVVQRPGMYVVRYGDTQTEPFQIAATVFHRNVWQPTLEYFLPVQMCHMRVNDRYRVWHGDCHEDDARMAPTSYNHFDGYIQGPSTLTKYAPGEPIPGLNVGGWHDAGDYDMRIESQADTISGLTLAWEAFHPTYDNTSVDQKNRVVEIQRPDGKPDILQQIEHGALSIVGGYNAMGRLYRGIIEPTKRQYTHLGDPSLITDNRVFDPKTVKGAVPPVGLPGSPDDRWVFTEDNPGRELGAAASLAAASRSLRELNPPLAADCLRIALELWNKTVERSPSQRIRPAIELLLATNDRKYADFLVGMSDEITRNIGRNGPDIGRVLTQINDPKFTSAVRAAVKTYQAGVVEQGTKTPYGVPYQPDIWGAGWGIQRFGVEQFFLHRAFPDLVSTDYMLHALDFILGCHPGSNTSSFVSGVGARSLTTAYGFNRADFSYIPGGSGSGTALIRPDYPELLEWPFLWQQTEYVLGGGTTDYLTLALAADELGKSAS